MGGKTFNSRRAPPGQVKSSVDGTCRGILKRSAGGNIQRVTKGIVQKAAAKNGLPVELMLQKLRSMGARI